MKKLFAAILLIITPVCIFAASKSKSSGEAGFEAGIGTGYVFYGDSATKDLVSHMNSEKFARFIISGDVGFFVPLAEYVSFVADAELMNDLFWKGGDHCYFFDYSFNGGVKVMPGFGGLGFTVDYCLGRRTSCIKYDSSTTETRSTEWGNGFKFAVDYDIHYEKKDGVCPVVGAYWRHMPRGDNFSDNTISIYLKLLFR